ncbi:hypothetical protein KAJ89_05410, partial [Candidatus Parcubacteria bacterium]|nr:hypothetical protein [Candidatus Parcubacteria bacterium]
MARKFEIINIGVDDNPTKEYRHCSCPKLVDPEGLWGFKLKPIVNINYSECREIISVSLGTVKSDLNIYLSEIELKEIQGNNSIGLCFEIGQIIGLLKNKRVRDSFGSLNAINDCVLDSICSYVFPHKKFKLKLSENKKAEIVCLNVIFLNCNAKKLTLSGNLKIKEW